MNTQFRLASFVLICSVFLPGCAALRTPGDPVTLKQAVEASVAALSAAEEGAKGHKWGLLPAEVTLTYHISDEQRRQGGANMGVAIKGVSAGADVSVAESTQRGNAIVMKFTKGGR